MSKIQKLDLRVSDMIRSRRMLLGINQSELAEAASVSVQQIQKYERGKNRVSAGRLYELAKILKVPVQYFFHGDNSNILSESNLSEEAAEFSHYDKNVSSKDEREMLLYAREAMMLLKVFSEIKCPKRRKFVVDMIKFLKS